MHVNHANLRPHWSRATDCLAPTLDGAEAACGSLFASALCLDACESSSSDFDHTRAVLAHAYASCWLGQSAAALQLLTHLHLVVREVKAQKPPSTYPCNKSPGSMATMPDVDSADETDSISITSTVSSVKELDYPAKAILSERPLDPNGSAMEYLIQWEGYPMHR